MSAATAERELGRSAAVPSAAIPSAAMPGAEFTHAHRPRDPRVSVVVPAKDEAPNILEVLPYLQRFYEVIVVVSDDDHDSADAARTALPSAKIVHQTRTGKGNALICGFEQVTGDIIVTFDIDGSADPHEIPHFVRALVNGADLAKGSRFRPAGGSADITPFRTAGNLGLNMLASTLTNTRFTDLCYGFNAFWADQLPRLDLPDTDPEGPAAFGDGFEIEAMILGRFALSRAAIVEVPSYEHHRYHGETNLNAIRDGFRVLHTLVRDRFSFRPRDSVDTGPLRPAWMRHNRQPVDNILYFPKAPALSH